MKRRKALLVNDMQNDFLDPGGVLYCGFQARRIIPFVARKIDQFHREGDPVIFVSDAHRLSDYELKIYPPHAMKGSSGAKLIRGIQRSKRDYAIEKRAYSGFSNPRLMRILKRLKINEVYLTGVCTSICVMEAASRLYQMKMPTVIYSQGVADFDPKSHEAALKRMKKIFGVRILP
ncbi:MAG: cysteine hydrolase [Candidatus Omnitrophica bacterium]|nr:cysteine hydrolase [Candidatus Omnitrophota bacterium]